MSLFGIKCLYCRTKIEKDKKVVRNVKVPGFIGTSPKNFCSEEHANKYNNEIGEYLKKPRKTGGGCCG